MTTTNILLEEENWCFLVSDFRFALLKQCILFIPDDAVKIFLYIKKKMMVSNKAFFKKKTMVNTSFALRQKQVPGHARRIIREPKRKPRETNKSQGTQTLYSRDQNLIIQKIGRGRANAYPPSTTNYDVHSPTWGDGKPARPQRAMRATDLGHGPSCSPVDPVQVSMEKRSTGRSSYSGSSRRIRLRLARWC